MLIPFIWRDKKRKIIKKLVLGLMGDFEGFKTAMGIIAYVMEIARELEIDPEDMTKSSNL